MWLGQLNGLCTHPPPTPQAAGDILGSEISWVLGRFSMYYRFLMYAWVSPETFLILLLYCLNPSQFRLKCIWSSNYLIKEIISQTVYVLLFRFSYRIFLILVQLTTQCNNSYHSEKCRVVKFIILVDIAHLWLFF